MKLEQSATKLKLKDGQTDQIHWDDDLKGFGLRLRVVADGRVNATWIVQYRKARGGSRRMKIGTVDKLTAKQAREAAKKILARVELGEDPQGDKEEARRESAHTLRTVVDEYLAVKLLRLRPASYKVMSLYLTGPYFKPLHHKIVTEIGLSDVAARVTAITRENGAITASRARSSLSTMFSWAMGEGLLGERPVNPVVGTNQPAPATPRDRVLADDELVAIWRMSGDDDYGRIVKLLALTGCRRKEVGGLRWSEIKDGKILLTAERVKNAHPHTVPLSALAISIIKMIPQRLDRDHLSGERSGDGFRGWSQGKVDLDARLEGRMREPWRLHDLRRTCATGMANLGVLPHVIEAALNHQSGSKAGVAGVYNRSGYEKEVAAAMAQWSEHVQALVDGVVRVHLKRA